MSNHYGEMLIVLIVLVVIAGLGIYWRKHSAPISRRTRREPFDMPWFGKLRAS